MKIRPVGADYSMRTDGWTDKHDESSSRFRNLANASENGRGV